MRITKLILAVILVTSRYENQFLSLSYTVNAAVSVKFDSCELEVNPCLAVIKNSAKLRFWCLVYTVPLEVVTRLVTEKRLQHDSAHAPTKYLAVIFYPG